MKKITNYICEKLKINKNSINKKYKLTLNEFKDKVNNEIIANIDDDRFSILEDPVYLGDRKLISKIKFIDITNNQDEKKYYVSKIACHGIENMKLYYLLNIGINGYFINYINTDYKNAHESDIQAFRYAYIIGKDHKQIDNVHIFSITL